MVYIKTGDIPCSVFVSDVDGHEDIKRSILEDINKNSIFSIYDQGRESIHNTDFYIDKQFNYCNYPNIAIPIFEKHNRALTNFLGYDVGIVTKEIWYQQYATGDFHCWHRHNGCTFSNVYYVELPEKSSKTTFRFLKQEFVVDVKEGQILTFPSFLYHCSKPNQSKNIKTIISFNSS